MSAESWQRRLHLSMLQVGGGFYKSGHWWVRWCWCLVSILCWHQCRYRNALAWERCQWRSMLRDMQCKAREHSILSHCGRWQLYEWYELVAVGASVSVPSP